MDVETGGAATISNDPYQNQYNMNEDMFWSYNLHNIQPQWYHVSLTIEVLKQAILDTFGANLLCIISLFRCV